MAYPPPAQGVPVSYAPSQVSAPPGGYPPPQQQQAAAGGYPPAQSLYPDPNASLADSVNSMSLKPRAGTTALLSQFGEGNIIVLECQATGQSLHINNGDVEGTGGRDKKSAQFTVHVRRPAVVALQNVGNNDYWLGIMDDRLIGTARGGPYCEFIVGEVAGKTISLESTYYPGQHIGILPNGEPEQPSTTTAGHQHSLFVPFLISEPAQSHPPLPVQAAPQPQLPSYQESITPAVVPGAVAMAPQAVQYPPQQTYPQGPVPLQQYQVPMQPMRPQMPAGPQLPLGFHIMDSFYNGNLIQLICRGNGFPVFADKGRVTAKGMFSKPTCNWLVTIPPGAAPDTITLKNDVWGGIYLDMKNGFVKAGNGKSKTCHFIVEPQPDNYCCFRSALNQDMYLNFMGNGVCGNLKTARNKDSNAQFFIRIEKRLGPHSQVITTMGRPSISNLLRTDMVIQLYLKSTGSYLGVNSNGIVYSTSKDSDPLTHFKLKDRGMGIVSFDTRKFPGFRLRMESGKLVGKGSPDLNSDFRVKDMVSDGTVCFESVMCPNAFIGISVANGMQTNLNIAELSIQRVGATENITKKLLN